MPFDSMGRHSGLPACSLRTYQESGIRTLLEYDALPTWKNHHEHHSTFKFYPSSMCNGIAQARRAPDLDLHTL
ncbi:hypothetical protein BDZ89DRAFT_1113295 [Hymenopellis radicata]|nr:hypothetical protein BDZ89DRAFT_1113295 [Hymenopellis radicata]